MKCETRAKHEQAFRRFHADNPEVYETLRRLAFKLKVKGVDRWGIKALYEVCRYELQLNTTRNAADFRLNNNYTAFYARELMRNEEDLADFFEVRQRRKGDEEEPCTS